MKTGAACRIVKLGGSLYSWPPLADRFQQWLAGQRPCPTVIVPGGGRFVEAIRDWDRRFAMDSVAAHWTAVDLLSVTGGLLSALLGLERLGDLPELIHWTNKTVDRSACVIFDPGRWMRQSERARQCLPPGWQVTGDSIAAALAVELNAEELVLLKSTTVAASAPLDSLAELSVVDGQFPRIAHRLSRLRIVNLRDRQANEWSSSRRHAGP